MPKIPAPIFIGIDNREQTPFDFSNILADKTYVDSKRKWLKENNLPISGEYLLDIKTFPVTVPEGDYCLCTNDGLPLIEQIVIERKSITDLLSSLTHEREREERKFKRMHDNHPIAWLVCEGLEHQVSIAAKDRGMDPKVISRTRISWSMKYFRCHWYFARNREAAATFVYRALELFYRKRAEYAPHLVPGS